MTPTFLLSVCNSHRVIYNKKLNVEKIYKRLKPREVNTLIEMCNELKKASPKLSIFDGYFVGYVIPQISNEFDLLRFSDDLVINIEIKSPLSDDVKLDKITTQMKKNMYYLKFLGRKVSVYTFIENDGFYFFNEKTDRVEKIDISLLIDELSNQTVDYYVNLDKEFKPSNYLVSPFNKCHRFLKNEYFLTPDQQKKKKEILEAIENNSCRMFCIAANAGTGKTLLTYDIAKTFMQNSKKAVVIHCGKLNDGQYRLRGTHGWNIHPIASLRRRPVHELLAFSDIVIVDEAQRIAEYQLKYILDYVSSNRIPTIFSYDIKQYLKEGEIRNIFEYLSNHGYHNKQQITLTNKIRTNKEMASFINNMLEIGKSPDHLNYQSISIEYFDKTDDAKHYMEYLFQNQGWKTITFTSSNYDIEPLSKLSTVCSTNAHDVIGQEFDRVVFAMDDNFAYNDKNRLTVKANYYSAKGMLYQIITRAVNELKIIVIDNTELYEKLLSIKYMGETNK